MYDDSLDDALPLQSNGPDKSSDLTHSKQAIHLLANPLLIDKKPNMQDKDNHLQHTLSAGKYTAMFDRYDGDVTLRTSSSQLETAVVTDRKKFKD